MANLQEPECESLQCDRCALEEALSIIESALLEHERTWGPVESYQGDEDWAVRGTKLLATRKNSN